MQTNIKQIQPSEYELEITATTEDMAPKIDEALRVQRTRATMKGFRPGKVPMSLVRKMYGKALAYEIAEKSIQETYEKEVLGSEDYDVMGQPKLTELRYEDIDGEMRAVIRFSVRPEVELKDFEGEKVTRLIYEVSDEDVQKEVEALREREGEMVPLEREAGEDDFAVVDLQRLDDASGTPIVGEKEEGVSFFLNDPRLKDELRDAIMGKKAGDTFKVEMGHEQEHEGHTQPHTHTYQVTLHELKQRELPELTSEFIEKATEGAAADEQSLRSLLENQLNEAWERQSREYLHDRIVDRMLTLHEVDVPEAVVDVYLDSFVEDVRRRNEGKLPPDFDEDQFRTGNREEAGRQAKWALIRDRLIEDAGLEVTDEDRQEFFARSAEGDEVTPEALAEFYKSVPQVADQLDQRLLSEKVFSYLESKFTIEEKDREAVEEEIRERAATSAG